jgi:hypothetical protein
MMLIASDLRNITERDGVAEAPLCDPRVVATTGER